jgi:hypothetical protein
VFLIVGHYLEEEVHILNVIERWKEKGMQLYLKRKGEKVRKKKERERLMIMIMI